MAMRKSAREESPISIRPFALERYFAKYEFKARFLLSSSDCESLSISDLLQSASPKCRKMWEELSLGYTESQGHPLLRDEISRLYQKISPEHIIVAVPEEAIFIAMQTLLVPGDHIVSIFPAYQSLSEIARFMGCQVTPWKFYTKNNHWCLDINKLERAITPKTKAVVLNFPHNPTGFMPSLDTLNQIIELARAFGLYIFMDEMYRGLELHPDTQLPAICDAYEKGISLSGLSKTYALPGLRIGWLATQDKALPAQWITFKDYTTICNSAPSEILALMALQNKTAIIQRNLAIIKNNLDQAGHFFERNKQLFSWFPPSGGSIAFPQWLGAAVIDQFCIDLVNRKGVMLVPGSKFNYPGQHFRLGLGRKNFPEAIAQLDQFVHDK